MFRKQLWILLILTAFGLLGCTAAPVEIDVPLPEITPTPTTAPISGEPESPGSGSMTLMIWLPPEFDPANDSLAGQLLLAQLEEFSARRPQVRIETRIKAVDGPGGIADTLQTASAAAPLALPDLVALPYTVLGDVAVKGLIHPFDGLTTVMDDPDWYEYARQLSNIQDHVFGIPFAGDALITVYRPAVIEEAPVDWASILEISHQASFPAADLNALLTLTFYQAAGGAIVDDQGRPTLEVLPLTDVLTFYNQGSKNGVIPFWLTSYETDDQAWAAYQDEGAQMVITWASRYLQTLPPDSMAARLPTPDGSAFTNATGWAWALASLDPDRQAVSAELAEFLSVGDYASEWAAAAGYLPLRPSGLRVWENTPINGLLGQICSSAALMPPTDIILSLGPVLQGSALEVIKEQSDPAAAAQAAVDSLASP
ncbi:MAG: extracellular solute-binding protein [Chloroflexi bacterium]|nr:extracellular solute-binding protein [Chloroflexota bacterium]